MTIIPFPLLYICQGVSNPTVITFNIISRNWFSIKNFYSHLFFVVKLIANNFRAEIVNEIPNPLSKKCRYLPNV